MEVDTDEEIYISGLYRCYQRERDDINQRVLFNIKNASKKVLDSMPQSQEESQNYRDTIQIIKQQAYDTYIRNDVAEKSGWQNFIEKIHGYHKPLFAGAVSIACLIAFLSFNFSVDTVRQTLPTSDHLLSGYHSQLLRKNSKVIAESVNTTVDWQYGFALREPVAHDAFLAGAYVVDLVNLDQSSQSNKMESIIKQLSIISDRINNDAMQNAIDNSIPISQESIQSISTTFELFYKENSESDFFKFGKWVEYNYLLTKLAVKLNDATLFSDNVYNEDKFMENFVGKKDYPQYIKSDLEQIMVLSSNKEISLIELSQQLRLLEKIRNLLR